MLIKSLRILIFVAVFAAAQTTCLAAPPPTSADAAKLVSATSAESRACIGCHQQQVAPLIFQQWTSSRHASAGIGCYECHQADKSRPEAFQHFGKTIAVLVGPTQCATCHKEETAQFEASHHAAAGQILGSLDNVLGDIVEGPPASVSGCQKCHGSKVKVLPGGKFDPTTWPNEGIGRLNPDGSKGSSQYATAGTRSPRRLRASRKAAAIATSAPITLSSRSTTRASTA
jgi:hydroxylamine dehydrogenase